MQVRVENGLAGDGAVRQVQVHTVDTQRGAAQGFGQGTRRSHHRRRILRFERRQIGGVHMRNDQEVTPGDGVDVEESRHLIIAVHDVSLRFAADDPAKDALRIERHAGEVVILPPRGRPQGFEEGRGEARELPGSYAPRPSVERPMGGRGVKASGKLVLAFAGIKYCALDHALPGMTPSFRPHGILSSVTPVTSAALMILAVALYGVLHSWLASLSAKALARRLFGPSADRFYRLAFNTVGAITLLPLLAFTAWQPGRPLYSVPPPFTWLFLAGQAAALAVIGLGLLQTGPSHFLGVRQLLEPAGGTERNPPPLTTGGLYRYVRHPLYTAGFVFLWMTPVMTSTLLSLYLGFSLYLYVGSLFEERRLLLEFGADYQAYQRKVPRLFPGWPRRRPDSTTSSGRSA